MKKNSQILKKISQLQLQQGGYTAIATVLVITVVVLVLTVSVSLLSVEDIQSSLASKKGDESLSLVEGCAEDALMRLNLNGTIPATIPIHEGTCSVTINSQVGDLWTFTVTASFESYTKSIQIIAQRTTLVTVQRWIEL